MIARSLTAKDNMHTVLCIDDDPAILLLRKDHLEGRGYTVLHADNGPDGLALFASHPVHCVVVDYHMPGMNGDRVARETKRLRPQVPVLFVTGGTIPEDVLQWVDGILTKDSLPSELLERIEFLLVGRPLPDDTRSLSPSLAKPGLRRPLNEMERL